MRRADLEVGQAYLTSPSNDWDSDQYAGHAKALLVDAGRWESTARYGYHHTDTVVPTVTLDDGTEVTGRVRRAFGGERAPGVLVRTWDAHADDWSPYVRTMRPQELRATWDEGSARVSVAREARDQRIAQTQDAAIAARKRVETAIEALGEAGQGIDYWIHPRANQQSVDIRITVRSIDALEAIAATYRKASGS